MSSPFDDPADGVSGSAPEVMLRPDDLVGAIGRFLGRLWAAPVPESGGREVSPDVALELVRRRVEQGLVNSETFDEPYRAQSPARLVSIAADLNSMLATLPSSSREEESMRRWVHGTLSVPALKLADGEVVGWPTTGSPMIGDHYLDLACLARSMAVAIGPAAAPALFDAAGIDRPNPIRLEFWVIVSQIL